MKTKDKNKEIDLKIMTLKRIMETNKFADKEGFAMLIAELEKKKVK